MYTAADVADLKVIKPMMPSWNAAMTQTLLASDTVRYVGEPVAAIVTEHPYQGEDAAELVAVDYDPLPAVVTMDDALAGQDACCSPRQERRVGRFGDDTELDPKLFDGCEVVVSRTIVNQRVAPAPMESRSAAAAWGEERPAAPRGSPIRARRARRARWWAGWASSPRTCG